MGTWTAVIPHHHVRHSIPPDSMSGTIFVPHRRVRNWVPHTTTSAARSPATSQAKLALVGCSQTWATTASWSSPSCSPHSQNQGGPNPFAQLGKHPRVTHSHEKLRPCWHCCITSQACQAWTQHPQASPGSSQKCQIHLVGAFPSRMLAMFVSIAPMS